MPSPVPGAGIPLVNNKLVQNTILSLNTLSPGNYWNYFIGQEAFEVGTLPTDSSDIIIYVTFTYNKLSY